MAISILFYNILIPIHILEEKVAPLEKIMRWNRKCNAFHDDHLYHEGFMGGESLDNAIQFWRYHGLIYDMDTNSGDFCVFSMDAPNLLLCPWLEMELSEKTDLFEVWLKGKPKGVIYGPTKGMSRMD